MAKFMTEQDNFIYLTVALVLLLFIGAVLDQFTSGVGEDLVGAATVVTLAIGVWSIKRKRHWFRTGVGFVVAILIVAVLNSVMELAGLHYAQLLILLGFFILTAWLAARQVLFTGSIDGNKIIGAVCIYLLIALIWAMLYLLLAQAAPASFNGLKSAFWYDNFSDLVYFSFISLTTIGYGDVTPAVPVARFLAYMEGIVGQFYIAIVVASLVGARMSDKDLGQ